MSVAEILHQYPYLQAKDIAEALRLGHGRPGHRRIADSGTG
ncbi:MAG: DUF433 domain-containing protein [Actinomycetota bacterium]|nr:DUF433 domain-containing protein [Actinomycetota bacterium]